MRRSVYDPGGPGDDLEETLEVHLQSVTTTGETLEQDQLEQIIGGIQQDLLAATSSLPTPRSLDARCSKHATNSIPLDLNHRDSEPISYQLHCVTGKG